MHETMVFEDLAPIEIPVEIGTKRYVLREATEDGYIKYRNRLAGSTRFGKDGRPSGIEGIAEADLVLLCACLYEKYDPTDPSKERAVVPAQVLRWRSKLVRPLVNKAKEISDIDEATAEEEEENKEVLEQRLLDTQKKLDTIRNGTTLAKNEQGATMATSV